MRITMTVLLALVVVAVGGCASSDSPSASAATEEGRDDVALGVRSTDQMDDEEQEIPLSDVPDHVKNAAIAAVPGIVLEEAATETEDGELVYELEGEANGVEYEVEVNSAGEVLEIETDDDEEDEDEDDEGEDDDE